MNGLIYLLTILGSDPASSEPSPAAPAVGLIIENPARTDGALVESPQVATEGAGGEEPLAPQQISPARRQVGEAGQLSRSGDRAPTGQVFRGERSASPPAEPLSRPADGRTTALVRVEGDDRCDPQAAAGQRAGADCTRVIETRSEEFRRADAAVLSPEQRLLIEQRSRERSSEMVVRRIANGAVDPNLPEDQAIASLTLDGAGTPAPQEKPKEELPAGADALINAIVNRIAPPQN